jgi:hypothetical protein
MIMAAVSTSETSVNLYQTALLNIQNDSQPHTRRRENLNCHSELDMAMFHIA